MDENGQGSSANNADENTNRTCGLNHNVLASVFQDLPSPQRYDPSWYNNKLRGEFGQLGSRRCSGPLLPKSYHLQSGDLDDLPETDEEGSLPATLRRRSGDFFAKAESRIRSRTNLHVEIKQDEEFSPLSGSLMPGTSRVRNGNCTIAGMVTSPVTNEFENEIKGDDETSVNFGQSDVADEESHLSNGVDNESNADGNAEGNAEGNADSNETGAVVENALPSGVKKSFRFGRKSNVPSTSGASPSTASQPKSGSGGFRKSIGRQSNILRRSLLFGQGERDTHNEHDPTPRQLRSTRARGLGRKSTGPSPKIRSSAFGRRGIILDWSFDRMDALQNMRTTLETEFRAMVTSTKGDEVRMQVPVNTESRNSEYSLVVSAEQTNSGSRVVVRRAFTDCLRGRGDEFDWLCAQIMEQLRQQYPANVLSIKS